MTTIERMKAYIEKTGRACVEGYELKGSEILALMGHGELFDALCIAFNYGRAKGYCEGKREAGWP